MNIKLSSLCNAVALRRASPTPVRDEKMPEWKKLGRVGVDS
jgi:hypothetical protein